MSKESDDKKATMKMIEEQAEIYRKRAGNTKTGWLKGIKEKKSTEELVGTRDNPIQMTLNEQEGEQLRLNEYSTEQGWVDLQNAWEQTPRRMLFGVIRLFVGVVVLLLIAGTITLIRGDG